MNIIQSYEDFILNNSSTVSLTESILQAGWNFGPTRLVNNASSSEGVYALINLLSVYHDIIFWKAEQNEIKQKGIVSSKQQLLLPSWWRLCSILLSSITATELFFEIYFTSKGKKWKGIFIIELIRAVIRLYLLKKAKGSMIVRHRVPQREKSPVTMLLNEDQVQPEPIQRQTLMHWARTSSNLKNSGKQWYDYWSSLTDGPISTSYIPTYPETKRTLGEILFTLRPIIYLLAIKKYGLKSWKPWIISFCIDIISHKCSTSQKQLNDDEISELQRRRLLWFLYLLRTPFFESIICKISTKLTPNFILNNTKRIRGGLRTTIKSFRDFYFYTAGSD